VTSYVADASLLVDALTNPDPLGQRAAEALALTPGDELAAPAIVDLEVTSALCGLVLGHRLPVEVARAALGDLIRMPIERIAMTSLLERVWDLRANATAYDASYIALAEALDATLITTDEKFEGIAGRRCQVMIIGDSKTRLVSGLPPAGRTADQSFSTGA
jgi:predicted nucleic acid-binding protein